MPKSARRSGRTFHYVAFGVSAAAVIAGVLIEGTDEHPSALFICWFFARYALIGNRWWTGSWPHFLSTAILLGLSMYGAVWTLGPNHAVSPWSGLVYGGMAGAILASLGIPSSAHEKSSGVTDWDKPESQAQGALSNHGERLP